MPYNPDEMEREQQEPELQGGGIEERVFTPDEIPDDSLIMPDGRVLVRVPLEEAEFVEGDDGFLYSAKTGKAIAEIDEADGDIGYEVDEKTGYDEDEDEGVSEEDDFGDEDFDPGEDYDDENVDWGEDEEEDYEDYE